MPDINYFMSFFWARGIIMSVQQSSILGAKQPSAYRSVIYAGLIAGFLDVLSAVILFANKSGNNPIIIFNTFLAA